MTNTPTDQRRREQQEAIAAVERATAALEAAERAVRERKVELDDAIYRADRWLQLPQFLVVQASPFTNREQVRRSSARTARRRAAAGLVVHVRERGGGNPVDGDLDGELYGDHRDVDSYDRAG